ncbi:hypothetical protein Pmani_007539 [Petrolisthes manimaculis]|uniref:Uncharacterized protein n=1 Tax=Petrolisthes manimaculis TaxID=1843537 RepID=A0AAE1UEQ8_9EUCA|nr:hypothetical protein Pmani_007539 [Petrolisthes manimaculis]
MTQGPSSMPSTTTVTFPAGQQQIQGTWANSGVDINLDNLSLGGIKKTHAPSMNQLQTTPILTPGLKPTSPPPATPPAVNPPGMVMMSGQMMGGAPSGGIVMGNQPMTSPVMNGNVMIPGMMMPGARMPGVVGMHAYPSNMVTPMPQMMGMVPQQQQQQPVGPMSMPSNMGL